MRSNLTIHCPAPSGIWRYLAVFGESSRGSGDETSPPLVHGPTAWLRDRAGVGCAALASEFAKAPADDGAARRRTEGWVERWRWFSYLRICCRLTVFCRARALSASSLYIYRNVRSRNFPSGGDFFGKIFVIGISDAKAVSWHGISINF